MVDLDITPAIIDKAIGAFGGLGAALLAWVAMRKKEAADADKSTMDKVKSLQSLQKDFTATLLSELDKVKAELNSARKDNAELSSALAVANTKLVIAELRTKGELNGDR